MRGRSAWVTSAWLGAFDEEAWSIVEQNGATVLVGDTLAVFGEHSLHIHLPATDGARGGLRTTGDFFALTNNHFFGRGFVLVTPEVPQTHGAALAAWGDRRSSRVQGSCTLAACTVGSPGRSRYCRSQS